jgi:hypothetical protein
MTNLHQKKHIYDRGFLERKRFGDIGENCFYEYLSQKYGIENFIHRDKEPHVDLKLPDFALTIPDHQPVEFEIKTTSKIKLNDYNYQYQYAVKNNVTVWYVYVKFIERNECIFRAIKIEDLLDYRLMGKNGVYQDSIPKPYFIVDWDKYLKLPHEKKWFGIVTPFELPTS